MHLQDGAYSSDELRTVFARCGEVEDVVLREGKKKSKGSAFVVMATLAGAAAAAQAQNGDVDRPLLVTPFSKVGPCICSRLQPVLMCPCCCLAAVHARSNITLLQSCRYTHRLAHEATGADVFQLLAFASDVVALQ